MYKTRLTELFGIEYPIIQGGMMRIATADLSGAVSEAGGLGVMTALTQPSPEALTNEIARIRTLTDKPFGVNLTFLPGLNPPNYDEFVRSIIEAQVPIVETAGRSPEKYLPMLKEAGIKVIHKCTAVRHALKAEKIGCDAVTIDGFECGGHPGENDTPGLVLIPAATAALEIPVVACGGFGNGQGLAAALALGAEGICMGTRFMITQEAPVHENIKQAMVEGSELSTSLIFRALRNTERVFKNKMADEVVKIEREKGQDLQFEDIRHLVTGQNAGNAFDDGDPDGGIWSAGVVMGLIHDIPDCRTLVHR
ncbi:MAG: nitronate monooxygenase, partial [Deltaproteobacteria bacterium]|nr:nitronate monooxygenase [Deltaproteobacteria bacterium]